VLPDFVSKPSVSAELHPVIAVGTVVGVRVNVAGGVAVGVFEGVYVYFSVCVIVGVKEGV